MKKRIISSIFVALVFVIIAGFMPGLTEQAQATTIESVSVNFTEPVEGAVPADAAATTDTAGVSMIYKWTKYVEGKGDVELGEAEKFEAGETYGLFLYIIGQSANDYYIKESTTLILNGESYTCGHRTNTLDAFYEYTVPQKLTTYTHADITVQEPEAGQKASYIFNIKSKDTYGDSYLMWLESDEPFTINDGDIYGGSTKEYKANDNRYEDDLTFEADKYYACRVWINMDESPANTSYFDSSYTATINGKKPFSIFTSDNTYAWVDLYFGKPIQTTTPTTPSTPTTGDSIVIKLTIDSPIINVNGVQSYIDSTGTKPVILNSRTLLPVRAVVEAMGGTVGWDGDTRVVTMTIGNDTLSMQIGNNVMWDNHNKTIQIDTAPTIINNRTMLPIRFVAEYFGASVGWNGTLREVTVTYEQTGNVG